MPHPLESAGQFAQQANMRSNVPPPMSSDSPSTDRPRASANEIARVHGWNATSFQTLGAGFQHFFHGDGYVAYTDTGSAWVAAGAPVCRVETLGDTARAFIAAAATANRRCCFFGVETRFLDAVTNDVDRLLIGEQPVWNPQNWKLTLKGHSGLREQLRRARAKKVVVRQATDPERAALREPFDRLIGRWLATRAMPPMGFLVAVPTALESRGTGENFVAWRDGHIVGIASLIPVPGRGGWFIEHLLRDPQAPNGTVELLIDAVMRWAASTECSWLTLGLVPLAGDVPRPMRLSRQYLRWLYDFDGLRKFKDKLRPGDWIPIYLAFPRSQGPIASTFDVLSAFTNGGMLRFGGRFIVRGHPALLATLCALLVVWTALLAGSSATYWFAGHAAVKWAWVAFDAAIIVGIVQLIRTPSWQLAALLATAVSIDAFVTPIEAIFWNLDRITNWFDVVVVVLACAAPLLAAVMLWGTTVRLRKQI